MIVTKMDFFRTHFCSTFSIFQQFEKLLKYLSNRTFLEHTDLYWSPMLKFPVWLKISSLFHSRILLEHTPVNILFWDRIFQPEKPQPCAIAVWYALATDEHQGCNFAAVISVMINCTRQKGYTRHLPNLFVWVGVEAADKAWLACQCLEHVTVWISYNLVCAFFFKWNWG